MDLQNANDPALAPWGKFDRETGATHHLAHHCADVAAVFRALLDHPLFERAASRAAGTPLEPRTKNRLTVLAFLHDIGKLAPGFQARAWPAGRWQGAGINHIDAACRWLELAGDRVDTTLDGALAAMLDWCDGDGGELAEWFRVAFSHHGRPVVSSGRTDGFGETPGYDWQEAERELGAALQHWLPDAFGAGPVLPVTNEMKHFFAGLLSLADWVGSDRRAFPFAGTFDPDYWTMASRRAQTRLCEIGLAPLTRHLRDTGFGAILPGATPTPVQKATASAPADSRLIILESETGSGKTEAALWRYARLRDAGAVESLYFAVPTRAAASQLFARVNRALQQMFDDPPEAVLAIPGMVAAGEASGQRLPDWSVLWDDDAGTTRPARWAAEHATRYLAAEVAVGTVDQAMLAALCAKHAHLRGAALARSLLVIDEVHASDTYMRHVQTALLRQHLALGGHALLMSATLGAVARAEWLGQARPALPDAIAAPYPAVWQSGRDVPHSLAGRGRDKHVRLQAAGGWDGATAASLAVKAARRGARVLVIRNTVAAAVKTWQSVRAEAPELLLQVADGPALHHSRFAAEDRRLLDRAVEAALGKQAPRAQGLIVIGTQTLEQSLDIDADYLITDLCPMDVLLQRIGRLHRHERPRPEGFATPQVAVLAPPGGLEPLLERAENGLGAYSGDGSLSGVYVDVPALAATLEEVENRPEWVIPAMNRELVEAATHPEALDVLCAARGPAWERYRRQVTGKELAERGIAGRVILDRSAPFPESCPDDERIRTRIGEDGVVLPIAGAPLSPFGQKITRIALPPHWSRGLTGEEELSCTAEGETLHLRIADREFEYGRAGLTRA